MIHLNIVHEAWCGPMDSEFCMPYNKGVEVLSYQILRWMENLVYEIRTHTTAMTHNTFTLWCVWANLTHFLNREKLSLLDPMETPTPTNAGLSTQILFKGEICTFRIWIKTSGCDITASHLFQPGCNFIHPRFGWDPLMITHKIYVAADSRQEVTQLDHWPVARACEATTVNCKNFFEFDAWCLMTSWISTIGNEAQEIHSIRTYSQWPYPLFLFSFKPREKNWIMVIFCVFYVSTALCINDLTGSWEV